MFARSDSLGVPTGRWREAQRYEQAYWQRLCDGIEAGTREHLDWYQWRADQLEARLEAVGAPHSGKILEIGSGPIGIVNFLSWGERYAIDPLEHYYRTRSALVALRKPEVTYRDGAGEDLPFESGAFSLVIIDNVIDHTTAPERVLREIRRVLAQEGRLYLSVNVHTAWGALLHTALAELHIDKGHPHTYTSGTLRRRLRAHGFIVQSEHIEDYRRARADDRSSTQWTDRVKGYTGLSEFPHGVICRL